MKRLIPAAFIFIFVLTICICGNNYVDATYKKTMAEINSCYEIYQSGNKEQAEEFAENLSNNWHKTKVKLAAFVNHSFLDNISVYMSQLPVLIQQDSESLFLIAYKNIESSLEQMAEEQKFHLHSFY